MTRFLRTALAALLAALAFAFPARATTYSTDFSDQWWNPAESGWGLNVVQQQDILFLTLFVYGTDNAVRWFVGPSVTPVSPQPTGLTRFSGTLYQTTGPYYGGSFNPSNVVATDVGTITVSFNSPTTGTLSFTVGGTTVTKDIRRQAFRAPTVTGVYVGGMFALASSCTDANFNGPSYINGKTTVTHGTNNTLTARVDFFTSTGASVTCTFTGPFSSQGRLSTVSGGTWACVTGGTTANAGSFSMTGIDPQVNGFHANFTATDQYCTYNGRFGGTRDVVGN